MNFKEVFPTGKAFLPVIHCTGNAQAIQNAHVAFDNGADGVFLIDHGRTADHLERTFEAVRVLFPAEFIGINFLDLDSLTAVSRVATMKVDGLWTDIGAESEPGARELDRAFRLMPGWHALYFGGFAFKHQMQPRNLADAAFHATAFMDVLTTSGDRTGMPPSVEKIKTIRWAIDSHPLAIASGMTPENVHEYLPYADAFLVATGISDSFTELNPTKVAAFAKAIHG